jgi:hypothetical protein
MGASKDGGYIKQTTVTPEQDAFLKQLMAQINPNAQAAASGYQQFLPGGGGGQAITEQANKNFQQNTIPSILNAFGTGSKGSSSLNQALAAGASNLNTDLASKLSELQLQASQGLGNLSTQQAQIGSTPMFAYQPKQKSFLQELALVGTKAGGDILSGYLSGKKF